MDNELFELCKEVYTKTRWGSEYLGESGMATELDANNLPNMLRWELGSPLYTSDYLLAKLPKFSPANRDCYLTIMEKQVPKDRREDFYWTAGYFSGLGWSYTGQSDTPLKALLRLTVALHEKGELYG